MEQESGNIIETLKREAQKMRKPLVESLELSILQQIDSIIGEYLPDPEAQEKVKDIWKDCESLNEFKSRLAEELDLHDVQEMINSIRSKLNKKTTANH